jgi:hypothetical protein
LGEEAGEEGVLFAWPCAGENRKRGCGRSGRRLLKQRRGEAGEGRSARVCHAAEGEGEKGGLRGADSQIVGSGWLRVAL